jgi:hypothetical protein
MGVPMMEAYTVGQTTRRLRPGRYRYGPSRNLVDRSALAEVQFEVQEDHHHNRTVPDAHRKDLSDQIIRIQSRTNHGRQHVSRLPTEHTTNKPHHSSTLTMAQDSGRAMAIAHHLLHTLVGRRNSPSRITRCHKLSNRLSMLREINGLRWVLRLQQGEGQLRTIHRSRRFIPSSRSRIA